MTTVAFATLGCKVNQVETEQIKEDFYRRGYQEVDFQEKADVYVINTCTVTHVSDRKSRAVIRRAIRTNPEAFVVVTGCMAQADAKDTAAIEGIGLLVGNGIKQDVAALTEKAMGKRAEGLKIEHPEITIDMKPRRILYRAHHQRTRAFIKVQDGCESFCSYCIVPYSRGPMRSKLPEDVLEEIRQLLRLGYREIVLTGIHVGYYGAELPGWNLLRLLQTILAEIPGDYRLRLGSIEVLGFPLELAELAAEDARLCPHYHIPLQSGSDKVLKEMNRRYGRDTFREIVEKIAEKSELTAFTSDVMVGFPGETDADFEDTRSLLAELPFVDLHVFKYSQRPGTPAAARKDQVSEDVRQARSNVLLQLAEEKKHAFLEKCIGRTLRVLAERRIGENLWLGLTDHYAEVQLESDAEIQGQFVQVQMLARKDGMLLGKIAG